MNTAIDHKRARAALARLSAIAASAEGQDACSGLADELYDADMGRAVAADVRQLVLPLADAANDDAEGTDGE